MTRDTLEQMFPYARQVRTVRVPTTMSTIIEMEVDDKFVRQFRSPDDLYDGLCPRPVRQFAVGRHPLRLVKGRR